MEDHLRAGVAVFNAGFHHAAHDAWEDRWLDLESGTDDERLLHGLIQYTAAVHHANDGNWAGCRGLAESGAGYLEDLPVDYRDVNVGAVRTYLRRVAEDPEHVERESPPALTYAGRELGLDALSYPAAAVAAEVLAETFDWVDEAVIAAARTFADEAAEARVRGSAAGEDRFVTLLGDFVADAEHRRVIYQRLAGHVERRLAELEDVEGLFDERGRSGEP